MLWMECFDPHEPWDPPRSYADRYYDFPKGKDGVEFIYPPEAARLGTEEEKERTKALYYGEITYMDDMIGRLMNTLAELGRLEDTVVMVTCDHGTELLDHGRFGKSADHLYAHNTQLNWIVRDPRGVGRRGKTIDAFVQNHDIVPTALDLIGLLDKWPGATAVDRPEWAGRSAKGLIDGSAETSGRDYVITGWGNMASVRDKEFNYIVRFEDPGDTERLFDLKKDPLETKDVASDHADRVKEGRRRLEALLGQELGTRLPDGALDDTMAPCRAYYGSPRASRQEQASGFV